MDEFTNSSDREYLRNFISQNQNTFEDIQGNRMSEYEQTRRTKKWQREEYENEIGFDCY